MRKAALAGLLLWIGLVSFSAFAQWSDDEDSISGPGFVAFEGGVWRILGDARNAVEDPVMLYFNAGFNLAHEFGLGTRWKGLTFGPKIGLGFGQTRGISVDAELLYDFLVKFRYTFGPLGQPVRLFFDLGPGVIGYRGSAFEVEAGAGVNFYLGKGLIGVNIQYKELFLNDTVSRGVVFLGTLGYAFDE